MSSLLQKAKAAVKANRNHKHKFTRDEKELCIAWMMDEISLTAVTIALDMRNTTRTYLFLATCARQIFQEMGDE